MHRFVVSHSIPYDVSEESSLYKLSGLINEMLETAYSPSFPSLPSLISTERRVTVACGPSWRGD
jgi:hypothetical protein